MKNYNVPVQTDHIMSWNSTVLFSDRQRSNNQDILSQ